VTRSQNGGHGRKPLAANVSSLAFTYLQNDGQTTAASARGPVWYIARRGDRGLAKREHDIPRNGEAGELLR